MIAVWKEAMANLDSILKSRNIILLTKVHIAKATFFPSNHEQMWEWTIKKAYHQRIDTFELWCWRKFSRVPWTSRRSKQSILKEINPEYSLEGLILKLKRQYFGHMMQRVSSLEKTLMMGKIERKRRKGQLSLRDVASTKALALDMLKFGPQNYFDFSPPFQLEERVNEHSKWGGSGFQISSDPAYKLPMLPQFHP